jgi:hypothetical protein
MTNVALEALVGTLTASEGVLVLRKPHRISGMIGGRNDARPRIVFDGGTLEVSQSPSGEVLNDRSLLS